MPPPREVRLIRSSMGHGTFVHFDFEKRLKDRTDPKIKGAACSDHDALGAVCQYREISGYDTSTQCDFIQVVFVTTHGFVTITVNCLSHQ